MELPGWKNMNQTERRAFLAAVICFLFALVFGVLIYFTGLSLFSWLFFAGLTGMFAALGVSDLRRHRAQAAGEFLIAAAALAIGIMTLFR